MASLGERIVAFFRTGRFSAGSEQPHHRRPWREWLIWADFRRAKRDAAKREGRAPDPPEAGEI